MTRMICAPRHGPVSARAASAAQASERALVSAHAAAAAHARAAAQARPARAQAGRRQSALLEAQACFARLPARPPAGHRPGSAPSRSRAPGRARAARAPSGVHRQRGPGRQRQTALWHSRGALLDGVGRARRPGRAHQRHHLRRSCSRAPRDCRTPPRHAPAAHGPRRLTQDKCCKAGAGPRRAAARTLHQRGVHKSWHDARIRGAAAHARRLRTVAVGAAGRLETKLGHILQAAVEGKDNAARLLRGGDGGHNLPLQEHLRPTTPSAACAGALPAAGLLRLMCKSGPTAHWARIGARPASSAAGVRLS